MGFRVVSAAALAAALALAGCSGALESAAESTAQAAAPIMVMPRLHHEAMRDRAGDYCESFGGEPELVDWRYRSTFGKRGEWAMQTIWVCREPAE